MKASTVLLVPQQCYAKTGGKNSFLSTHHHGVWKEAKPLVKMEEVKPLLFVEGKSIRSGRGCCNTWG